MRCPGAGNSVSRVRLSTLLTHFLAVGTLLRPTYGCRALSGCIPHRSNCVNIKTRTWATHGINYLIHFNEMKEFILILKRSAFQHFCDSSRCYTFCSNFTVQKCENCANCECICTKPASVIYIYSLQFHISDSAFAHWLVDKRISKSSKQATILNFYRHIPAIDIFAFSFGKK